MNVLANEPTASKRRVYFDLRDATDFVTPELGEEGGQPQISTDGAAWTDTGIGTLLPIGGAGQGASCAGRYYGVLTQAAVLTAGIQIETRYKSANTVETPGDTVRVVAYDQDDATRMGLVALPEAAADAAGGLPISDAGGLDLDTRLGRLDVTVGSRSTYAGGEVASVAGDVGGKVLGGGASAITGTGARVVDGSGNALATTAIYEYLYTAGLSGQTFDVITSDQVATSRTVYRRVPCAVYPNLYQLYDKEGNAVGSIVSKQAIQLPHPDDMAADRFFYGVEVTFPPGWVGGAIAYLKAGLLGNPNETVYVEVNNVTVIAADASGQVTVGDYATDKSPADLVLSTPADKITNTGGKVLLQATQTGVTIPTVTTLTNAPADSAGVTTLLGRLTGITSLANWLRGLARKDAMNATAKTELNSGGGSYEETTDSLQARADAGITLTDENITDIAEGVAAELDIPTPEENAAAAWVNDERTLTQTGAQVAAAVAGSSITAQRGDTFTAALTGLGSISGRTKLWFTVKRRTTDADSAAVLQITEAGGLLILNGATAATPANGSITVDDAAAGNITIGLTAAATALLAAEGGSYDVQWKTATGEIHTLTSGIFQVNADVTQAVT